MNNTEQLSTPVDEMVREATVRIKRVDRKLTSGHFDFTDGRNMRKYGVEPTGGW